MRKIIGAIAFFLAPVTFFLSDVSYPVDSISATYWTHSGDLFVGSLMVVGFFLAAYNGTGGRDWEFYLSKIAAVLTVCVALFPTKGPCLPTNSAAELPCKELPPPSWTADIAFGILPKHIHNYTAVALFICLFFLLWFFSNRAKRKGKDARALLYRFLAGLMIAGMVFSYLLVEFVLGRSDTILWVESFGLTVFGAGWLVAGSYANQDLGEK